MLIRVATELPGDRHPRSPGECGLPSEPLTHCAVVTYQSPLLNGLGVPHAFSTRLGGVSGPPFDSLSFQPVTDDVSHLAEGICASDHLARASSGTAAGGPTEDRVSNVAENFRRLTVAVGCGDRRVICLWQVHGRRVCVWPDDGDDGGGAAKSPALVAKADAAVTRQPDVVLAVRVADCVPVLLAGRDGRTVAAIHAGWRGVADGVVPAAVETMARRFDVNPSDLVAAVGPCISVEHFEVGPEVAQAMQDAGLRAAVHHRDDWRRPHVDLPGAIALQLSRAGVPGDRIDRTDRCTWRDRDEFFSHRRDAGRTGRMAAVIATAGR